MRRAATPEQREMLATEQGRARLEYSITQGKRFLAQYALSGIDYVNFQWHVPDAAALGEAVAFLEEATGLQPVTSRDRRVLPLPGDRLQACCPPCSNWAFPTPPGSAWITAEPGRCRTPTPPGATTAAPSSAFMQETLLSSPGPPPAVCSVILTGPRTDEERAGPRGPPRPIASWNVCLLRGLGLLLGGSFRRRGLGHQVVGQALAQRHQREHHRRGQRLGDDRGVADVQALTSDCRSVSSTSPMRTVPPGCAPRDLVVQTDEGLQPASMSTLRAIGAALVQHRLVLVGQLLGEGPSMLMRPASSSLALVMMPMVLGVLGPVREHGRLGLHHLQDHGAPRGR